MVGFGEHLKDNIAPEYGVDAYLDYTGLDDIIQMLSQTAPSGYVLCIGTDNQVLNERADSFKSLLCFLIRSIQLTCGDFCWHVYRSLEHPTSRILFGHCIF
jgi:hypothetical protein